VHPPHQLNFITFNNHNNHHHHHPCSQDSLVFTTMASNTFLPSGPQPDYHRMSQLHEDLANKTRKIPNAPQFRTGREILDTLTELEKAFNRLKQRLNGKLNKLE
jgi:hypothetical protein